MGIIWVRPKLGHCMLWSDTAVPETATTNKLQFPAVLKQFGVRL